MKLTEALKKARAGETGSVVIDEPWVAMSYSPLWSPSLHRITVSPGAVDLVYLLEHAETAREWRPEDAK